VNVGDAFAHIKRSYDANRLGHAYLVAGAPRRIGVPLAERIISLLVCEGGEKPCGTCRSCIQVAERTYPDVMWVEPRSKSRQIVIGDIRNVLHRIQQTSFSGSWKGCVLVGADRLGQAASNAFLKTLEEPLGQTIFLLLTDRPQSLLPTIVSRCQYMSVSDAGGEREDWVSEVLDILAGTPSAGGLTAVFARSDRMARLLKSLRQAAEELEKERAEDAATEEDADTVAARISARYRESRSELMRLLMQWYRDLLMVVCGAEDSDLRFADRAELLRSRGENLSYRQASGNVKVVEQMNRQLEMNLPEPLVMSTGFTELRG